jgi:hypothetical protein
MPLLEITQTRHVNASVRFTDATARLVDQYVTFLRSHGQPRATADDVIEQGVGYTFNKDREFQEYLKTPQAANVADQGTFMTCAPLGPNHATPSPNMA